MTQGHHKSQCSEPAPETLTVCLICRKRGHLDVNCPEGGKSFYRTSYRGVMTKPTRESIGEGLCLKCGERGHLNCSTSRDAIRALSLDPLKIVC